MKTHISPALLSPLTSENMVSPWRTGRMLAGLTVFLLTTAFVLSVGTPDARPSHADRVYKIQKWLEKPYGERIASDKTSGAVAPALKAAIPEIESAARLMTWPEAVDVAAANKSCATPAWAFADPELLLVLGLDLRAGEPATALRAPGQVALSESFAKKLFGSADPIGQTVQGVGGQPYTVCAVLRDSPGESAPAFDVLASWSSTAPEAGLHHFPFMHDQLRQTAETYVLLRRRDQASRVEQQLSAVLGKALPGQAGKYPYYLQAITGPLRHS